RAIRDDSHDNPGRGAHIVGHSFPARAPQNSDHAQFYRLSPSITLHGWGGLCSHQRPDRQLHEVLITAAGPAAGLMLGAISFGVQVAARDFLATDRMLSFAVDSLVFLNIFWSLINLLPLWPLDGGQLFRLGMVRVFGGASGERVTHYVGTATGVVMAIVAYRAGWPFLPLFAGYWAWLNFSQINNPSASGAIYSVNRFAKELAKKMRTAFEAGEYDEAYRLGQQIRAETNIDTQTLGRVWEVLGVVAALRDNYEEAWSYLKRAPERGRVIEARAACIIALEMHGEARAFVEGGKLSKIPDRLQAEIKALAENTA
ncbi:MAG: site-2 protease family protein, partial [Myxococcota bacterium]